VVSGLVGVHGIAQQQVGRHQLQGPWARALADGVERWTGRGVQVPALDIAFYGDLFLAAASGPAHKGTGRDAEAAWADLPDEDIDAVAAAAGEVLCEQELATSAQDGPRKGFGRVPSPLLAMVAALDRRFGPHAGVLLVGELGQVRRYLRDPELKAAVDARVAGAVAGECRVLIGHSLGSVVAFEFLRQHPDPQVGLLLTLGSPLGFRAIRHWMPDPGFGADGVLPKVGAWVNLRDLHDPVAAAGGLATWWPGVQDRVVDNEKAAHSAERYLSKRQTGEAVVSVLPELGW